MIDPLTAFPSARLVDDFFIASTNSGELKISDNTTNCGLGLGISIHTRSVPGIGAMILRDLALSPEAMSALSLSTSLTLIPASGLIFIWMTVGPLSTHSKCTGSQNSMSLFCNALAFSTKNSWSTFGLDIGGRSMSWVEKVGLSVANV